MSEAAKVRIARARGRADKARAELMGTVEETKARLAPGRLASDAVQSAKDKSIVVADDAVSAVKGRPGLTAGIATVAALFIARRPLFAAVGRLFRSDEAEAADDEDTTAGASTRSKSMEELNG